MRTSNLSICDNSGSRVAYSYGRTCRVRTAAGMRDRIGSEDSSDTGTSLANGYSLSQSIGAVRSGEGVVVVAAIVAGAQAAGATVGRVQKEAYQDSKVCLQF